MIRSQIFKIIGPFVKTGTQVMTLGHKFHCVQNNYLKNHNFASIFSAKSCFSTYDSGFTNGRVIDAILDYIGLAESEMGQPAPNYKEILDSLKRAEGLLGECSDPSNALYPLLHFAYANYYFKQGELENAKKYLELTIQTRLEHNNKEELGEAYLKLGILNNQLKNPDEALKKLEEAKAVSVGRASEAKLNYELGKLYYQKKDIDRAAESLEKCLRADKRFRKDVDLYDVYSMLSSAFSAYPVKSLTYALKKFFYKGKVLISVALIAVLFYRYYL